MKVYTRPKNERKSFIPTAALNSNEKDQSINKIDVENIKCIFKVSSYIYVI